MKNSISIGILFACGLPAPLILADRAAAQLVPVYSYRYSGWGGYPYGSTAYDTSRRIASQQRVAGQRRAMQQTKVVQSGIRSTLSSQAQSRSRAITSQKQDYRDWWFQQQEQKMVQQRQARASYQFAPVAPSPATPATTASLSSAADSSRPASIIKWPPLLQGPQFARQRAGVEAPYLKSPPGDPTLDDYRAMVDAAEQMKATLKKMAYEVSAGEYREVEKFLDGLATEARGRIEARKTPPPQPAE